VKKVHVIALVIVILSAMLVSCGIRGAAPTGGACCASAPQSSMIPGPSAFSGANPIPSASSAFGPLGGQPIRGGVR